MIQWFKELYSAHFSRVSLFIILLETAVICALIWLYVPLGFSLGVIISSVGIITGVISTVQAFYWVYGKLSNVYNKSERDSTEDTAESDISDRAISDAFQTTDQRFDEEVKKIIDWIRINEEGDITLIPGNDIQDDPRFLLYVVAAKVAYELDKRHTGTVTLPELNENVEAGFPADVFINKADRFLVNHYPEEDRMELLSKRPEQLEFEIDIEQIEDAIEWIQAGTRNVPRELQEQ